MLFTVIVSFYAVFGCSVLIAHDADADADADIGVVMHVHHRSDLFVQGIIFDHE